MSNTPKSGKTIIIKPKWYLYQVYKGMFYFHYNDVSVIVSGDTYRNCVVPEYTFDEFFAEFICDENIDIDEVEDGY